jgi:uncharacterized protein YaaR (DUF327 family)
MKDSIRSSLDDAFQKLAAQKKAQEETAEAKKTRDAAFLEVFLEKQKEVIRPAMEEMLSELKRRGPTIHKKDTTEPKSRWRFRPGGPRSHISRYYVKRNKATCASTKAHLG